MPAVSSMQSNGVQLALLVQKMDDLITRVECLKQQFDTFLEGRTALDKRLSIAENALEVLRKIVEKHEIEIVKLTEIIRDLGFTNRILKWMLGLTSTIAIALLLGLISFGIALLTGQAVIVRP